MPPPKPPLPEYDSWHFEKIAAFRGMMSLASERCLHLAESEKYFGYPDSWRTYACMALEMTELPGWLATVMPREALIN